MEKLLIDIVAIFITVLLIGLTGQVIIDRMLIKIQNEIIELYKLKEKNYQEQIKILED